MAVLAILSTLAVTGYLSAIRGMLKQRAATAVCNALVLARQRACTDAAKTSVACFNVWSGGDKGESGLTKWKACSPTYVVCKSIGQFTLVNGNVLGDEFSPLDRMFGVSKSSGEQMASGLAPLRLYNLTRGGWSDVYGTVTREAYPGAVSPMFPATGRIDSGGGDSLKVLLCFRAKTTVHMPGGWQVGDAYGVAVSPIATLPRTIYFGVNSAGTSLSPESSSSSSTPPMMQFDFYPDGHAEIGNVELLSIEPDLRRFKTIRVSSDGSVTAN